MAVIYKMEIRGIEKYYIGSTSNFKKRKARHLRELKNNNHHSKEIQNTYNKIHNPLVLFSVLKNCNDDEKIELEMSYIKKAGIKNLFNIVDTGRFGDVLTNNPKRDTIINNISESIKKRHSEMSKSDKERLSESFKGSKNPNWRDGSTFCKCGARISSVSKTCLKCRDRFGKNNSFYGKSHSEKTIKLIQEKKRGKIPSNAKKVSIMEVEYYSATEASRAIKCSPATILNRIKNKNFKDYYFI